MLAFEKNANTTASYEETIAFYTALAQQHDQLQLSSHGMTDSGHPLHTVVLSKDKVFDPIAIKASGKRILLVNNAIHPGEPCGVEASMLLLRDYLEKEALQAYLENVVIVVIPFYNIGGGLNRNSHSRTNQLGPEAYGFRGNAKNLDLNRDFIKCDSRNARTFNQIFNYWQADIFVDNHTSNGADYPYTMTLIPTQYNKLDPTMAAYLKDRLLPRLFKEMKSRDWEMTPYVYARNTPDEGIAGFLDLARYSSGYAALHHTISFMPETHMLKPYEDRVKSTYAFMDVMIKTMHDDHKLIGAARQKAFDTAKTQKAFALNWTLDLDRVDSMLFKGYEAKYKPSEVSGLSRLYYDRNAPYEKKIPFYNNYKSILEVTKPVAYIIPQAYQEVIERLSWNGVKLTRLTENVTTSVEMYRIGNFKTTEKAYEGHYLHSELEVTTETRNWRYYKGDYVIYLNQASNRYIMEMLEPQGPDSFFSWNFFDGILMQKEYFSSYVFEDLAAEMLRKDKSLKADLEARKKDDPKFANSAYEQLMFIYKRSPHYEPTHMLYPVARVEQATSLPTE